MAMDEDRELQAEEEWEPEQESRPGRSASLVFSVRFARDEIAQIRHAATKIGERTSEFIRSAALARAKGARVISVNLTVSTSPPPGGAILFTKAGSNTAAISRVELLKLS